MDHAEGAGVSQVAVERVGLRGIERGDHESHHRDRGELAGREDLAGEKLAKERQRRGARRGQRVAPRRGPLDADHQLASNEGC